MARSPLPGVPNKKTCVGLVEKCAQSPPHLSLLHNASVGAVA